MSGQPTEAEGTATFPVVPLAQPSAAVRVAPGSLTFSATTWNTAQTVTGVDDTEVDGNMAWNVRLSPTSIDSNHNGVVRMVSITTVDDAAIVVSRGTGALALTEGSTATYPVTLKGQPASTVVV